MQYDEKLRQEEEEEEQKALRLLLAHRSFLSLASTALSYGRNRSTINFAELPAVSKSSSRTSPTCTLSSSVPRRRWSPVRI